MNEQVTSNEKVCQCVRCGRTGDDASEFAKPCGLNGCGGQMHWWPASVRVTLDELTELRARPTHEPSAVLDYKLPCDIHLPPNTFIGKGCKLSTLMGALKWREGQNLEFSEKPRPAPPPSDALNERELENFTEIRGWLIAMRETAGLTPTGFGELLGLEVWLTEWIGARRSLSLTKSGCDCNAFPGADEFCTAHKFEPKQRTAGETSISLTNAEEESLRERFDLMHKPAEH